MSIRWRGGLFSWTKGCTDGKPYIQQASLFGTVVVKVTMPTHMQRRSDRGSSTYILSDGPIDSSSSCLPQLGTSAMSLVLLSAVFIVFGPDEGLLFRCCRFSGQCPTEGPSMCRPFIPSAPDNKRHLVAKRKASDWLSVIATEISAPC